MVWSEEDLTTGLSLTVVVGLLVSPVFSSGADFMIVLPSSVEVDTGLRETPVFSRAEGFDELLVVVTLSDLLAVPVVVPVDVWVRLICAEELLL